MLRIVNCICLTTVVVLICHSSEVACNVITMPNNSARKLLADSAANNNAIQARSDNVQKIESTPHHSEIAPSMLSTFTSLTKPLVDAMSDPTRIYLPQRAITSIVPAAIPLNSLRALLHRVYFGYLFYRPELRYGQCLFRYASTGSSNDGSTFEAATPLADNGGDASNNSNTGLDVEQPSESEIIVSYPGDYDDADDALLTSARAYGDIDGDENNRDGDDLSSTMHRMLHDFVCAGMDANDAENTPCARRYAAKAASASSSTATIRRPTSAKRSGAAAAATTQIKQLQTLLDDDATVRVYRTIMLNMLEQWMRSSGTLRPLAGALSGASMRRVRRFADAMLDSAMRRVRDILMPGLYGCTQMYVVEFFWRALETWL